MAVLTLCLEAIRASAVGLNVHETGLRFLAEAHVSYPCPTFERRNLDAALRDHAIVIVPGFFATRADEAMVTLGRGGSDLTAVLLAVGLRALRCELLKDVPGYFKDDPRTNARAAHLSTLTFEEALAMAERGCELVQRQALAAAADAALPLVVRSLDERAPVSVVSSVPGNRSPLPDREAAPVDA